MYICIYYCFISHSRIILLKYSYALFVQAAVIHAGRGLGGTSNINYMQYLRGSRHDYDSWAANGAHGWSYREVLPYFIKAEDQHNGEFIRTGELAILLYSITLRFF